MFRQRKMKIKNIHLIEENSLIILYIVLFIIIKIIILYNLYIYIIN